MSSPEKTKESQDRSNDCLFETIPIFFVMSLAALILFIFYLFLHATHVIGGDYLYLPNEGAGAGNFEQPDVKPVIEYVKPEQDSFEAKSDYEYRVKHPSFLYSNENGHRFVVFYAPWCMHCVHYKPVYISLANTITEKEKDISFYAVSCVAHHQLCTDQGVHGYPTVKFFESGSSQGVKVENRRTADWYLDRYIYHKISSKEDEKSEEEEEDDEDESAKSKTENEGETEKTVIYSFVSKDHLIADVSASFEFDIRNSIYMTGALSVFEASAFRQYIELLHKTLPSDMKQIKSTSANILNNFEDAMESERKLVALLNTSSLKNVGGKSEDNLQWTDACKRQGSNSAYTCGLWELFHTLTLGVVEANKKSKKISTMEAAKVIRDYIDHFFGCNECRNNFIEMYDSCRFERCTKLTDNSSTSTEKDWIQLPIWLWQVHNDVNVRLLNERRKRDKLPAPTAAEEQEVRWPSSNLCPSCWKDNGDFNDIEVYSFLHKQYWPYYQNDSMTFMSIYQIISLILVCLGIYKFKKHLKRKIGAHKKTDDDTNCRSLVNLV